MPKIVPIVEGGEVVALPKLLYKLLREKHRYDIQIALPKNAKGCENLKKPGGLEKFLRVAALEPDCSAVLLLMDADKDCPKTLAEGFAKRIRTAGVTFSMAIVVARCEYEAWFLASLDTMTGKPLPDGVILPASLEFSGDVEAKRGAKEWLTSHLPDGRSYKEKEDQPALTHGLTLNWRNVIPGRFGACAMRSKKLLKR